MSHTRYVASLLTLAAVLAVSPTLAQKSNDAEALRPVWTVGDWWEFKDTSDRTWRLTVIAREQDHYILTGSPRGTNVDDGRGRSTYRADLDGWITKSIAPDGKVTDSGDKREWVKFPMRAGSRWFFSGFSGVVGKQRTVMFDYDCSADGWETIDVAGRSMRVLKITCQYRERGLGYNNNRITGWYAPEAKRLVRLRSSYEGGPTTEVIAFGVANDQTPLVAASPKPPPPGIPPPPGELTVRPSQTKPPTIAVNYPASDIKVERDQIVVVGLITADMGVARIQMTLNGSDVALGADAKGEARGVPLRATVQLLPGDNVIEVTASDKAGNVTQVVRTVTRVVASTVASAPGERLAVVIGVGNYDAPSVPKLRFATADADALYRVLIGPAGFKKENVLLLTDKTTQRPTLRNIKSALGTFLARSARKQDTVLVFFAGHGAPEIDPRGLERDGLAKYLIPSDADPNDLYATALSMDEIQTIFGRIEAERVVIFLDACYSGAAGGRTFASTRLSTRDLGVDDLFLDRLTRAKGRAIITASRPSEVSIELSELAHGLFSYYLIEGLKGAADLDGDGIVTLQELYTYVEREVSRKSRSVGGNQHPVLKGELEGPLPLARATNRR
jgi:hypothetical protein